MAKSKYNNNRVIKLAISDATRDITAELTVMCRNIASLMVAAIDNNFTMPNGTMQFPVDTANLHDATGVAVYTNGVCTAYIPTKRATKAQHSGFYGYQRVVGSDRVASAMKNARRYNKGVWIVLYSTVPYALPINNFGSRLMRGVGYFDKLGEDMLREIFIGLRPLGATVKGTALV